MDSILSNVAQQPLFGVGIAALLIFLIAVCIKIGKEIYWMGTIEFVKGWAVFGVVLVLGLIGLSYWAATYEAPSSSKIAIVVGNTQNTPQAKISGEVKKVLKNIMLKHAGDRGSDNGMQISIIEADGDPYVVDWDSSVLKSISENSKNAEIDVKKNIDALNKQIANIKPKTSGANYLEAILRANDELSSVSEGDDESGSSSKSANSILVIGSGLSDSGDLSFVGTNLLTNKDEAAENSAIEAAAEDHEGELKNTKVTFYGLGDVVLPQKNLSSSQREGVRNIYTKLIEKLGGKAEAAKASLRGSSVDTPYTVNPTDTGCGDVELTYDDSKLKFNTNQASFVSASDAAKIADQIVGVYNQNKDRVKAIVVDGYIAHRQTSNTNLSADRANAMKDLLIERGLTPDKITANGKGNGPYEYSDSESQDITDQRNRMIKVTIQRDSQECRD